jgi:glycerate dehydrogenase
MEPAYHQVEFDTRLWLQHRALSAGETASFLRPRFYGVVVGLTDNEGRTMKIVTLDGDTLPSSLTPPNECDEWIWRGDTPAGEVADALQGAQIAITNKVKLTADVLRNLPQLRYICVAATGYDCVDVACCRKLGIAVSNVPGYSTVSVAEAAIGYIFALRRHLLEYHQRAMTEWRSAPHFCIHGSPIEDIEGATLGIIGKGDIGRAVARKASALGMTVLFAERQDAEKARDGYLPFDDVLAQSDILTLHCPLSAQTNQLFNADVFGKMKPGALLINTARGGLVDDAALADALRRGQLGGAALDVLAEEPPRSPTPLLAQDVPHLIMTPHVGWASRRSVKNLMAGLSDNLSGWFAGSVRNRVA